MKRQRPVIKKGHVILLMAIVLIPTLFFVLSPEEDPGTPLELPEPVKKENIHENKTFRYFFPVDHDMLFVNCSFVDGRFGYCRGLTFIDCRFRDIYFEGAWQLVFKRCRITGSRYGLEFQDCKEIFITGSLFQKNSCGLMLRDCEKVLIQDSDFLSNYRARGAVDSSYTFENNRYVGNDGIRLKTGGNNKDSAFDIEEFLMCNLCVGSLVFPVGIAIYEVNGGKRRKPKTHFRFVPGAQDPYVCFPPRPRDLYPMREGKLPPPGRPVKYPWKEEDEP